jgi:hypothetical protein
MSGGGAATVAAASAAAAAAVGTLDDVEPGAVWNVPYPKVRRSAQERERKGKERKGKERKGKESDGGSQFSFSSSLLLPSPLIPFDSHFKFCAMSNANLHKKNGLNLSELCCL